MSSPVPKRAVSANSSSAGASAIDAQQDTDKVIPDNGHESPHMTLINSQKTKIQEDQKSEENKENSDN